MSGVDRSAVRTAHRIVVKVGSSSISGENAANIQPLVEALAADATLAEATEVSVQVHSIDPPHDQILRSIELIADQVAPALGLGTETERSAA